MKSVLWKNIISMFCMVLIYTASCQKTDYVWLQGYSSNVYIDSSVNGFRLGQAIMNFNYEPVSIIYDSLTMNWDRTNTSFCDSYGNLLFYTNGIYIANTLDEKIENSDSLNAGYLQYDWDPSIQKYGYRLPQGILAFQNASDNSQYYLIHSFIDKFSTSDLYTARILGSLLDMSANAGHGRMLYKNQSIIQDTLGAELSATRHANGRDWWILVQQRNTNCFYRILLNATGPHVLPDLTCGGSTILNGDIGSTVFSPDGTKYVCFTIIEGVKIFDFDRCNGELSNPVEIPMNIWEDSSWLGNGVAISPNNRFLYVSATEYMLQYDLQATNIAASVDTVGIYDGFKLPFGSYFHTAQIGPDGKIYVSCGNSEAVYHVINNPDEKGAACNFLQHGVRLPSPSLGVPNFPNYRLGALPGSPCDTLTGLNDEVRAEKERILKIYPNPANDYTVIDYGFTDWNKGEVFLEISNPLGQIVYSQTLPMYSGFQQVDVAHFSTGFYTACIKRKNSVIATAKLVKQ